MYISKTGSTPKQMAYARRLLGGEGTSKKEIALNSGYSPHVSNSIATHIENTRGFNNAMSKLAVESNNLALKAMAEFKARGFEDFTNKELVGALNAIGNAWSKFNAQPKEKDQNAGGNNLRKIVLARVAKTIDAEEVPPATKLDDKPDSVVDGSSQSSATPEVSEPSSGVVEVCDVDDPMDF